MITLPKLRNMRSTRYTMLTQAQLLLLATLIAALVTAGLVINSWYMDFRLLPEVHVDQQGACLKVVNLENGHAFNCADVNVLLRRYRAKQHVE